MTLRLWVCFAVVFLLRAAGFSQSDPVLDKYRQFLAAPSSKELRRHLGAFTQTPSRLAGSKGESWHSTTLKLNFGSWESATFAASHSKFQHQTQPHLAR